MAWPGIGERKKPSVCVSSKFPVPNCMRGAGALRATVRIGAAGVTEKAFAAEARRHSMKKRDMFQLAVIQTWKRAHVASDKSHR